MQAQRNKIKALAVGFLLTLTSFTWITAQDCSYLNKGNDIVQDGKCAPVDVTWTVHYDHLTYSGSNPIQIIFDWDDGSNEIIDATPTDPTINKWSATSVHEYTKNGDFCNYRPKASLVIDGIICTSSEQHQIVTVWETDLSNGNDVELLINPEVYPICVGNGAVFNFTDQSQWNCTPPYENDFPNERKRWIQWIYGTGATTMPNTAVGGSIRAYPYTGTIDETTQPIFGPIAPYNTSLKIDVPNYYAVGSKFEVTLKNWNVCNPYDDPTIAGPPADLINGDHDPVITTAHAIIVANPDGTITAVLPLCESDGPIKLTAATSGGEWSGDGIVSAKDGLFNPEYAGAGTHSIRYDITSADGCYAFGTADIVVYAAPIAAILNDTPVNLCPGTKVNLDGNPSGGFGSYTHSWTGDNNPLNFTNIQDPNFETNIIGEYDLTYYVWDENGCWGKDEITIDVDDVNIQFDENNINVCFGIDADLAPNPTGGSENFITHKWTGTRTDLLSDPNIATPTFYSNEAGIFTFDYYVEDDQGCSDTKEITITVHGLPSADPGEDNQVCGLVHYLAATPSIGTGIWKVISGTGTLAFEDFSKSNSKIVADQYGIYQLRWIENNNECLDSADINITFIEIPLPSVREDKDTCSTEILLYAYPHILGIGEWVLGSGPGNAVFANSSDSSTMVQIDQAGLYSFVWLEDNGYGCIGSDDVQISFFDLPNAQIAPIPDNQCSPLNISFANLSTNADAFLWDFGDGVLSTETNPTHLYENTTLTSKEYDIELIAITNKGCKDTLRTKTEVSPNPNSNFKASISNGCSPLDVDFINNSYGGTDYKWDFSDSSEINTETNPHHTFINNKTYVEAFEVSLVTTNEYNCTDSSKSYITVFPQQDFNFIAVPPEECSPSLTNFTADPGGYTYIWDFGTGNPSIGAHITAHLFENNTTNTKTETITLYTTSFYGCKDTTQRDITIFPSPKAFFIPNDFTVCSPKTVDFSNKSENITKSYWDFGDGTTNSTNGNVDISHQYTNIDFNPASYRIRLVVENEFGCKDSMDGQTSVYPSVSAHISGDTAACSPIEVPFINQSSGASYFDWNYGDGNRSSGYLGKNIFNNTTNQDVTYTISMVATSLFGCKDTAYTQVNIYGTPKAEFIASPLFTQIPESDISLQNTTTGSPWNYHWNFGDDDTSNEKEPGSHLYTNSGKYDIKLKVYSEFCSDSTTRTIEIIPSIPTVEYGPPTQGCPPIHVKFYSNALDTETFFWEFGDGSLSSDASPEHTYYTTGEFNVKLTVTGKGGQTIKDDLIIEVYPQPTALFSLSPILVKVPGEVVTYVNESMNADTYLWNFGDGNTSNERSPIYEYTEPGSYNVTLLATNNQGCTHEYMLRGAVTAEVGGQIDFPNAFTPDQSGSNDGRYPENDSENHIFYPSLKEGVVEYELQIFSRWGEILYESKDIKVGWNGYYQGKLCPQGVYIWKATCRFGTGEVKVYTGDVTLLR
ncbi:PKD domain-containing protein [bacterium]|nr:PKD domain-containing protein [bacterium]